MTTGQPERPEQRHDDKRDQSYEQARDELADVVRRLEAGGLTLEESLRLWERGERLAATCEEWLEGARARLSAALAAPAQPNTPSTSNARDRSDGGAGETPF